MLTLTGPGGIGKTRLAIEVGRQLEPEFPDGIYFVSLAGTGTPESILPIAADTLGLAFSGPASQLVQLANFLRTKRTLLILDNMEHLLAGGSLLGEILQQTQSVKMLVTSREQLKLQWEWLFEVQGLPLPEESEPELENNSAIRLFVQRARQASQGFSLKSEDVPSVVRICRLVGGLPLAIELAASWVRILSCRDIAQELERNLDFLETRKLDVPQRHRSIKTVFDHSWTLLTDEEQSSLMRLSVFQGGFTREAAISATGTSLAMLSTLVDKSLLRHHDHPDRYELHELIRQYTYSRLQTNPTEEQQSSEKYALHFANWLAGLEGPFKSPEQPQIAHLIRSETSNWRSSWDWAIEHRRLDLLRKMGPCLNWYFEVHGYYEEALSLFKSAVSYFRIRGAPVSLQTPEEKSTFAFLVDSLGWFEFRTGNVQMATSLLAESLELASETGDAEVLYYIYGNWGYLSLLTGDIPEAGRLTTESLRYGWSLTPWHTAIPVSVLGIVAYQQGSLKEAFWQLSESLEIWRSVGDPRGMVFCMLYLGMVALALGDTATTRSVIQESNTIAEAKMDRWAHAFGLDMLGMVCLSEGQNAEALYYFQHSLEHYQEIGDSLNSAQIIIHLGQAQAALHCPEEAKRLISEAYFQAQQAGWTPIVLVALVSFIEMENNNLQAETRLAAALSVLAHASVTPNLRMRCEKIRDEMKASLQTQQVEAAEAWAKEKTAETWAQEIIR
jgi:predicted ATPase